MRKTTGRRICLLLVAFFVSLVAHAQTGKITGTVESESGEKLPGVSVSVKGTTIGTITNANGYYELNVSEVAKSTLVYSFIGFKKLERKIEGKQKIDVSLKEETTQLEEVVAVGYGTMKKKDLTGAITTVDMSDMEKIPASNVAQAISGKVAGVQITSSEGEPGAGISIRVRGGGSITQDNEPLYVIDGFPTEDGMSTLDPSDIESIDILKDASSTAIYGARGANGVVVITTKGGKAKKTTVNFDAYFGIKQLSKKLDVLSTYDFVKLDYERSTYGKPYDDEGNMTEGYEGHATRYGTWEEHENLYRNRAGIDWQEESFGNKAYTQSYKLSVNGGSKLARYNFGYTHFDEDGLMINSGFARDNAKLKLDITPNDKLDIQANISYITQEKYGSGTSSEGERFNKMGHIIQYRPTIGKQGKDQDLIDLDEDPALETESGNIMQNPIASAEAEKRSWQREILTMNASLQYKITKHLTVKIYGGMRDENRRTDAFFGSRSIVAKRTSIQGWIRNDEINSLNNTNLLVYENTIGKHAFSLTLGNEQTYQQGKWFRAGASGFPNDDIGLGDLSQGTVPDVPQSEEYESMLVSFFGRAFYNYKERYLFTATLRADGSSKFGEGNKWGYFPSASFAWRAGQEDFIQQLNTFSNLKFRLGYGQSGNNRIGNYESLATLSSVTYPINGSAQIGVKPDRLPNPNLKWETTSTLNFGLDLGFLEQRIQLTAEFYKNKTTDLLLNATVPFTSGFATKQMNIGETQNKGMEFVLSTVNIDRRDFSWETSLNISFNRNQINSLVGTQQDFKESSEWTSYIASDYIVKVGEPVGQMYGWITDGLYQVEDFNYDNKTGTYTLKEGVADNPNNPAQPGSWKFKDIAGATDANGNPMGDGVINDEDRSVIGDANPVHFGGITNNFSYKQFDLSVFMDWSWGNEVYNASKLFYTLGDSDNRNVLGFVRDRWSTIDANGMEVTDPAALAEMNQGASMARVDELGINKMRLHSWAIEDGSFFRINNISLGYNIPKRYLKRVGISACRLYATANNIYTFTNYSGFSPEVSTRNSKGVTPGVDYGAYPRSRSYVFGVNVSF